MNVRLLFFGLILSFTLTSCFLGKSNSGGGSMYNHFGGSNSGDLEGVVYGKKATYYLPRGMEVIPAGSFVYGQTNENITGNDLGTPKVVTVSSFHMDDTEITNEEYLEFMYWVRDSIIRYKLAELVEEQGLGGTAGLDEYAFKNSPLLYQSNDPNQLNPPQIQESELRINWDGPSIITDPGSYPSEEYGEIVEGMYFKPEERINNQRAIDTRKLLYKYNRLDLDKMIRSKSNDRTAFIVPEEVPVYPDTTCWIRDFNYSFNEPRYYSYFKGQEYKDYPVVGVNWFQASAFCVWRSNRLNGARTANGQSALSNFRLPTEVEWEYAARGGLTNAIYPWGGPYTTNDRGCFLANFKPKRGDYAADGYIGNNNKRNKINSTYTVPVKTYYPNDFNLYDMAGNVAEWTSSSFTQGQDAFSATLNPVLPSEASDNKRKVIRGGSWKDVKYFLQVATRHWEYADSARSFVGFRTIQDIPN